jgi:peroxiredoxin (alkyl hydroperoxide reductase subunit C)
MNQKDFFNVDWSKIPEPKLDFNLEHLNQLIIPDLKLNSTDDTTVSLSNLKGITVIYVYPMTGVPGKELPEGWDEIPGARGCTPQSCSFRDNFSKLKKLGVNNIFGLSTQSTEYQKELATRLHLPYPILSDEKLEFSKKFKLPMFKVLKMNLLKRITLILKDNKIIKYFYPIFPPTKNIEDVINFFEKSKLE